MYDLKALTRIVDGLVPEVCAATDLDHQSPHYGSTVTRKAQCPEFDAVSLTLLAFAYAHPSSGYHGDDRVLTAIQAHCDYAHRDLSPEGLISLKSTNWHSPPDTAFAVDALWRLREGELSVTAGVGQPQFMSVKLGPVELACVKIALPYFGATFIPHQIEAIDGGIALIDDHCKDVFEPGYRLPLGRSVPIDRLSELHATRDRWPLPPVKMRVDIRRVEDGFELCMKVSGGVAGLVGQFECAFLDSGVWETPSGATQADGDRTAMLFAEWGAFHHQGWAISIGPGSLAHQMWRMRNSQPEPGFRVVVPFTVADENHLRIRCGRWSPASRRVVQPITPRTKTEVTNDSVDQP